MKIHAVALALALGACSDDASVLPDTGVDASPPSDTTLADQSNADSGRDAPGTDAPGTDGPAADAAPPDATGTDGSYPPFFKDLEGIWLVGWSGGMNHYSWVRFTVTSVYGGTATILDGASLTVNLPFWGCSGAGSFDLASKPDTVQIHFPASTCVPQGLKSASYTFSNISPAGSYPKGATHTAQVTTGLQPSTLEGYKFPASQCNPAMTSCTDPFL